MNSLSTSTFIHSQSKAGKKMLAVLIDPDKPCKESFLAQAGALGVDLFFVGGSLLVHGSIGSCIQQIRQHSTSPIILFPGSAMQIDASADGILLLSLISGRNPEYLIGQQVIAAPLLRQSKLDILPTGYLLIESGKSTTASYMSGTTPIPSDKPEIAAVTALAGAQLGLQYIYLDGGSGAQQPVSAAIIKAVKNEISIPLIVGGGIRSAEQLHAAYEAGADIVVIGTSLENNPALLPTFIDIANNFTTKLISF